MLNKPSMLMFVYNDLTTDARVQRSLDTLASAFDITILSTGSKLERDNIEEIIVESTKTGMIKYFDVVRKVIHYERKQKYEYVYLHDYYSCLVGLLLSKREKIIYDAHELIIGTREYPVSIREKFFGFFEKQIVKRAHLVICADRKRAEIMQKYYKLKQTPVVIPNYSELPLVENSSLTSEMIDFFNDSRKTFVYAGALVEGRHIDSILYDTSKVSSEYKVLIIGDGSERQNLECIAKDCNRLKYLFLGSIPYRNLGAILKRCDVGFLSYPMTDLNNIYCAPNKIYEYASVELPMICNDNPNLISVVGENGIGVCYSENGARDCVGSIVEALGIIDHDYEKYKNNIRVFRRENSWDRIRKYYLNKVQYI